MKKKIIISIITVFLICLNVNTFALTTLYEKTNTERISSGIVLKNYNTLSEKGWLDINVLEVNLNDKYTSVEKIKEKLKNEPYDCLCSIGGIGFKTADEMLLKQDKNLFQQAL